MTRETLFRSVGCEFLLRKAESDSLHDYTAAACLAVGRDEGNPLFYDFARRRQAMAKGGSVEAEFEEREPGFAGSMESAWAFMLESFLARKPISDEWLKQVHGVAMSHVDSISGREFRRGRFREKIDVGYPVDTGNTTLCGLRYVLENIMTGQSPAILGKKDGVNIFSRETLRSFSERSGVSREAYLDRLAKAIYNDIRKHCHKHHAEKGYEPAYKMFFSMTSILEASYDERTGRPKVKLRRRSDSDPVLSLERLCSGFVSDYQRELAVARSVDEVLLVIARLITKLEQAHPFRDGNTRLFSMLLLNRLLLENRLPLCMLEDPNRSSGYAPEDLVKEIKQGMRNYAWLARQANPALFVEAEEESDSDVEFAWDDEEEELSSDDEFSFSDDEESLCDDPGEWPPKESFDEGVSEAKEARRDASPSANPKRPRCF